MAWEECLGTIFVFGVRMYANNSRSIAQEAVAERFAFGAKDKKDMLGSFIRHGLTQKESEAESILQM